MLIGYLVNAVKTAEAENGTVYTFNSLVENKKGEMALVHKPADVKEKDLQEHLLENCNGRFVKESAGKEVAEESVETKASPKGKGKKKSD